MTEDAGEWPGDAGLDGKIGPVTDRDSALRELQIAARSEWLGDGQARADEVLCQLLAALGYSDVVEEYEKVERWFAPVTRREAT